MGEHHLHIHHMRYEHGQMFVDLADHGRSITIELSPSDHPALQKAWNELERFAISAAETVMLDLLGGALPDTLPVRKGVCRVCDKEISTTEPPGVVVYCNEHMPTLLGDGMGG